jgi:hypothetical protein
MDGVAGYEGWRWIFLLEGLATVMLGVACFFFMADTPTLSTRWLDKVEVRYLTIQATIREGGTVSEEKGRKFRWKELFSILTDYKVYMQGWILFCVTACSYGIKFTMPSITKSMGFSSANAQLLTIPPYVAGAISAYCFARLSDRFYFRWGRMPFIVVPLLTIVVGFSIIIPYASTIKQNIVPCYIGVVLICIGVYPTNPAGSAWISSNLAGSSKRAIGIAFNICLGNLGGIVGSYMFLDKEAPGYHTGFGTGLAFVATGVIITMLLAFAYKTVNKRRDLLSEDEVRNQYTEEQLAKMGDESPMFRYKL